MRPASILSSSVLFAAAIGCGSEALDTTAQGVLDDVPFCWESELFERTTGEHIAYSEQGQLLLADIETGERCLLSRPRPMEWNEGPAFASDGRRYAFYRTRQLSDNPARPDFTEDLYVADDFIARPVGCDPESGWLNSNTGPLFSVDGERVVFGRTIEHPDLTQTLEIVSAAAREGGCDDSEVIARFEGDDFRILQGMTWVNPRTDGVLLVALSDGIYAISNIDSQAGRRAPGGATEPTLLFDPAFLPGEPTINQGVSWSGRFVAFSAGMPVSIDGGVGDGPQLYLFTTVEWNPDSCIAGGPQPQFGNPPCIQPMGDLRGAWPLMTPGNDGRVLFVPWPELGENFEILLGSAAEANAGTGPAMDWSKRDVAGIPDTAVNLRHRPLPQ